LLTVFIFFQPFLYIYGITIFCCFILVWKITVVTEFVIKTDNIFGWLGGTTGSTSDQRSEGCGFEAYYVSQLTGNCMGVNCPLWPAATPSSKL